MPPQGISHPGAPEGYSLLRALALGKARLRRLISASKLVENARGVMTGVADESLDGADQSEESGFFARLTTMRLSGLGSALS
ncbi:hypothetical protein TRIP_E50080 [uncultured Spirochaetota bacterium]|nr:hypothetical protein TRIP_E50080 [uncultured Spirochaetota bacterium]